MGGLKTRPDRFVKRRYKVRWQVVWLGLALLAALAGNRALSGSMAQAARLASDYEWPEAVDVGPDGSVWLAMSTSLRGLGGLLRYSPELEPELAVGTWGRPVDIEVAPSGEVWLREQAAADATEPGPDLVSRFRADGRVLGSWPVTGTISALSLLEPDRIDVLQRIPQPPRSPDIVLIRFAADGRPLRELGRRRWPYFYFDIDAHGSTLYAVGGSDNIGAEGVVHRFAPSAETGSGWSTPGQPNSVSADAQGRVFVGEMGVIGGREFPFRYDVYDAGGDHLWRCEVEGGSLRDLAAGQDGEAYVLVDESEPAGYALRRYGPDCELLQSLETFTSVRDSRRLRTATIIPEPTGPRSPTPTLDPSRPSPTPTPTIFFPRTPPPTDFWERTSTPPGRTGSTVLTPDDTRTFLPRLSHQR